MTYIIKIGVAFHIVCVGLLCIFTSVQGKETALLLGGCGSVSGRESGETRLCFVGLVQLGVRFVFRVGRIFFGSMFNSLYIN